MAQVVLGPVLGYLGSNETQWFLSAILATSGQEQVPSLTFESAGASGAKSSAGTAIFKWRDTTVWRFTFNVSVSKDTNTKHKYSVTGVMAEFDFEVPKGGSLPNIFFASCNGQASYTKPFTFEGQDRLWVAARALHQRSPYHVMLMGGDNVYCDSFFKRAPLLARYFEKGIDSPGVENEPWTPELDAQLRDAYLRIYIETWGRPDQIFMFSRVPNLMMWDDHDIFDGYGSYPPPKQNSPFFHGVFKVARDYFWAFQMQGTSANLLARPVAPWSFGQETPSPFSHFCRASSVGILNLDMRSERSLTQVLSPVTLNAVRGLLSTLSNLTQLFVVVPIPIVFADVNDVEKFLSSEGIKEVDVLDDLRDTFSYMPHRQERDAIMEMFFSFADRSRTQVILIGGDTHIGALARIRSVNHKSVIYQPVCSGILANPPTVLVKKGVKELSTEAVLNRTSKTLKFKIVSVEGERACCGAAKKTHLWMQNFLTLSPLPGLASAPTYLATYTAGHNTGPKAKMPLREFSYLLGRS